MILFDLRVSIIIPVLNEAENIRQTLLALQDYRQQGHELIVVDGHSQDQTVELAKDLCDVLVCSAAGRALQMNAGAAQARGNILLFLHADTRLPDNALTGMINTIIKTGRVWGRFNVRLSGRKLMLKLVAHLMNMRSRLTGIATGDQAIFIQRAIFHKINGFANIPLMEDIQISQRLLKESRPVCLRDKVITSSRRWEKNGIIRTIVFMWYLRLSYFLGKSPEQLARLYSATR